MYPVREIVAQFPFAWCCGLVSYLRDSVICTTHAAGRYHRRWDRFLV